MRLIVLSAGLLLCSISSYGQEALSLSYTHYYSYSGEVIPDELYRFDGGDTDVMIQSIVEATGIDQNFTAIACNVSSIIVARNGSQRYILYNRLFLLKQPFDVYRYVLLAHAIGHHANQHQLWPESGGNPSARLEALREAEELAADEFAGFALFHLNIPEAVLDGLPLRVPLGHEIDPLEREEAMRRGYRRAEALLLLAPSAAYYDNGQGDAVPGIPEFHLPAPRPSASYDLTNLFQGSRQMGQIAQRIKGALDDCGYYEHQYYFVEGGFAMVTRIEQFNQDGSSMNEPARWSANPVRDENFDWTDYLRSLFTSDPGRFRVFVFLVTDIPWTTNPSREISRQQAENWLSEGANQLPLGIRQQSVSPGTAVTALVYEFLVEEGTGDARLSLPSELSSRTHMLQSYIYSNLSN